MVQRLTAMVVAVIERAEVDGWSFQKIKLHLALA